MQGDTSGKSEDAYRTISEVSEALKVPQHVLRFWESKFRQIRPIKGKGGRRSYRPEDVRVLRDIQDRLYNQGYTIKGVQKQLAKGKADNRSSSQGGTGMPAVSEALASEDVLSELRDIRKLLDPPSGSG